VNCLKPIWTWLGRFVDEVVAEPPELIWLNALTIIHKGKTATMHFKWSNPTVCRVIPDATIENFDRNKAYT
jgi:hypothetical protein